MKSKLEKKEKKQSFSSNEDFEEKWSLKRIIIGLSIIFVILAIASYFLYSKLGSKKGSVLGSYEISNSGGQIGKEASVSVSKKEVTEVLDRVKGDVSNINPDNIASSSQQIQQAINDLKSIQEKKDTIDAFCSIVCKK